MQINSVKRINSKDSIEQISAIVQNSIIRKKDIIFHDENELIIKLNRFMWEEYIKSGDKKRIFSFLHISKIINLKFKNFEIDENKFIQILAMTHIKNKSGEYILLDINDEIAIMIKISAVDIMLCDIDQSWECKNIPYHDINKIKN